MLSNMSFYETIASYFYTESQPEIPEAPEFTPGLTLTVCSHLISNKNSPDNFTQMIQKQKANLNPVTTQSYCDQKTSLMYEIKHMANLRQKQKEEMNRRYSVFGIPVILRDINNTHFNHKEIETYKSAKSNDKDLTNLADILRTIRLQIEPDQPSQPNQLKKINQHKKRSNNFKLNTYHPLYKLERYGRIETKRLKREKVLKMFRKDHASKKGFSRCLDDEERVYQLAWKNELNRCDEERAYLNSSKTNN